MPSQVGGRIVTDVNDLLAGLAQNLALGAARGLPLPERLCRAASSALECDGGAITLAYTHVERVTLSTTDEVALELEQIQDVVGQGPGPDAFTSGLYCRYDLLAAAGKDPRWPLLESESLTALAPLVVHAIPMGGGNEPVVGVLTLHQLGLNRDIDVSGALVVARVVMAALVGDVHSMQDTTEGPWSERAQVHQATGMVVAQLGLPEVDVLALLRAHAFSHDQSLASTARSVIERELEFSANPDQEIEST
jgi:hypothetical protein